MGTYTAVINDCLYLNFAVKPSEIERLLPPGVELDLRHYRGRKWGFFSVLLYSCDRLALAGMGWPRFSFFGAETRIYIIDDSQTPSAYLIREYLPWLYSNLVKFYCKMPTCKMNFDYPRSVHPGGVYSWNIEGSGAGAVKVKINESKASMGQLADYFSSQEAARDFFTRRPNYYYAATRDNVRNLKISASYGKKLEIDIQQWELGFTASDLERHRFPEAVSGCFYAPEIRQEISGPHKESLSCLTGA